MTNFFNKNINKKNFRINLLAFAILLYVFRMAIPGLFYLFLPVFLILCIIICFDFILHKNKKILLNHILIHFYLFMLLAVVFFIAIIFHFKLNLIIIKDLINLLILFVFILSFFLFTPLEKDFLNFIKQFSIQFIISSVIISIIGILKFLIFSKVFLESYFLFREGANEYGTTLVSDYNFYALCGVFGFFLIINNLSDRISKRKKLLVTISSLLIFFNVFFSFSRRGIFVLALIILFIILIQVLSWFIEKVRIRFKYFNNGIAPFLYTLISLFLGCILFFLIASNSIKTNLLTVITDNPMRLKMELSACISRYFSTISHKYTYEKVNDLLWNSGGVFEKNSNMVNESRLWMEEAVTSRKFEQNILRNSRFSDGFNDWEKWGESECYVFKEAILEDQPKVLLIKAEDQNSGIRGLYNVNKGDKTVFHAKVRVLKWGPSLRLMVRNSDSLGYSAKIIPKNWEGDSIWHNIDLTVDHETTTLTNLWLGGGSEENKSISLWKDLIIERNPDINNPLNDTGESEDKLLTNGDFLYGFEGWKNWGNATLNIVPSIDSKSSNYLVIESKQTNGGITTNFILEDSKELILSAFISVRKWSPLLRFMVTNADGSGLISKMINKSWENDGQWHIITATVPYEALGRINIWLGGGSARDESISCWTEINVINHNKAINGFYDSITNNLPLLLDRKKEEKIIGNLKNQSDGLYNRTNKILAGNVGYIKLNEPEYAHGETELLTNRIIQSFSNDTSQDSSVEILTKQDNVITSEEVEQTGRIERWKFALRIYWKDYNIQQKIIGNGFDFLSDFGKKFYNDPNRLDWPHNPFISSLLFSGLLGTIIYIIFLIQVVLIYIKSFNKYSVFFFGFLMSFLFVFFSGNNYFDTPLYAMSLISPFYIKYLNKG